jgi:hypothetical protein
MVDDILPKVICKNDKDTKRTIGVSFMYIMVKFKVLKIFINIYIVSESLRI